MSTANQDAGKFAITADATLNEIIAAYPHIMALMQHYELDTCCGGAITLETASQHHGLDLDELVATFSAAAGEPAT